MTNVRETRKTLVLGLDGATFDVLDPLMEEGHLPNILALRANGVSAELESTYPPVTGPAWVSMATGRTPGRTGVFDFRNRMGEGLQLSAVHSSQFQGTTLWDYLGEAGHRVGVFNFPTLYPPYSINGVMVGGIGTPERGDYSYPSSLKDELDRLVGGYRVKPPSYQDPKYTDNEMRFIQDLEHALSTRVKAAEYLLRKENWDLFFAVFNESDFLQHFLWKHWDDSHPAYDPNRSPVFREGFKRLWRELDKAVGRLQRAMEPDHPDDLTTLIVSDHGFGPQTATLYLNRWLEREGYLVRRGGAGRGYRGLKRLARETLSSAPALSSNVRRVYRWARQLLRGPASASGHSPLGWVDRERSRAVALGANRNVGALFFLDPEERKALGDELKGKLIDLGESHELPVPLQAFRPDEIYKGEYVDRAPDLLVNFEGFQGAIDSSRFPEEIAKSDSITPNQTGLHRSNGILIAQGPAVQRGKGMSASIPDIAPTVLYLMGYLPPEGMDGKVLRELFTDSFLAYHETVQLKVFERPAMPEAKLTQEDEEEVLRRLEDLGYL